MTRPASFEPFNLPGGGTIPKIPARLTLHGGASPPFALSESLQGQVHPANRDVMGPRSRGDYALKAADRTRSRGFRALGVARPNADGTARGRQVGTQKRLSPCREVLEALPFRCEI
jgi:hypothetical protein